MYLHCNIPPMQVWIRNGYLYDFEKDGFTEGLAFSVKSTKNHALMFQVMTDVGAVYDKLPISALCTSQDAPHFAFDLLQLWDCPSYHCTAVQFEYLRNKRCQVMLKDQSLHLGIYLFTLDWAADKVGPDTSFAEQWNEHKSAHIIELDSGCLVAQPNNRVLWADPAWIHQPFEKVPDYKTCSKYYVCERNEKWVTEDSNRMHYSVEEK